MARKLSAADQSTLDAAQAQIKKVQAQIAKNNTTIAASQATSRTAVQKLQSGKTLTDIEKASIGTTETPLTGNDSYYSQKVGTTGMTQAQLDARDGAIATAKLVGGTTINNPKGGLTAVAPNKNLAPIRVGVGGTPTSGVDLLRATLSDLQIPSSMLDTSIAFIDALMADNMDEASAMKIYYNNKDYTTKNGVRLESPFYKEFTYLKEFAPKTGKNIYTPLELMQFNLGVKDIVKRYGRNEKFASAEYMKQYIQNGVKITDLDQRFADYSTAALSADPNKVATLKAMGYINSQEDLADFYGDPKIGQEQFEINRNTAAFAQQALTRSSYGLEYTPERLKQLAARAGVATAGGNEADISANSAKAFQTIADILLPETKLAAIYQKQNEAQFKSVIQSELEAQQFEGVTNQRLGTLVDMENKAFQGRSGKYTGRTAGNSSSIAGMI